MVSAQQRRCAPKERGFTMKISGDASAIEVVLKIILLVCALADVTDVAIRFKITDQAEPGLARRRRIGPLIKPTILHTCDHREGKHAGAGRFRPCLRMVDELAP